MSQSIDHPLKVAAIAVAGTITLTTLVVSQWILPTQTASLNHEIILLKERLSKEGTEIESLKLSTEKLSQTIVQQKEKSQKEIDSLIVDNRALRDKLFTTEMSNTFINRDAYPIGLDKVRIGDPMSKIAEAYRNEIIEERDRTIIVKHASELFLTARFRHSAARSPDGKIDSIIFDLGTIERITDKSLPRVPNSWLEQSLRAALGEPILVGEDDKCRLWKTAANEPVYYLLGADWFEISGYVTYPAGCYPSKEQLQKRLKARSQSP